MIKSLLSGLTIGSVGTLLAMQYHLVRTDERFIIVSRVHQPPLRSAYVDIRHWSAGMWQHYPELREAMVKAGRQDLMAEHQPTSKTREDDSAIPFHDVSKTGNTPILNAAEARVPAPAVHSTTAVKQEIQASPATPMIALGAPRAIPAPASPPASPPMAAAATIQPEPVAVEHQRTVPQPEGMPAATPQAVTPPSAAPPVRAAEPARAAQTDWVQTLLKSIAPSKEAVPAPRPSAAAPPVELPAESIPQEQDEEPGDAPAFPASPRRIPVAQFQEI